MRPHARFNDPASDFVTLLRIWQGLWPGGPKTRQLEPGKAILPEISFSPLHACVSGRIFTTVDSGCWPNNDIPHASRSNCLWNRQAPDHSWYAAVHQAILSGFLSNIAMKKEKQIFQAAHQREVMLFPRIGPVQDSRDWIVAAEMVETSDCSRVAPR